MQSRIFASVTSIIIRRPEENPHRYDAVHTYASCQSFFSLLDGSVGLKFKRDRLRVKNLFCDHKFFRKLKTTCPEEKIEKVECDGKSRMLCAEYIYDCCTNISQNIIKTLVTYTRKYLNMRRSFHIV